MTTATCTHCGTSINARGPEPAVGRFCMATECQRERQRRRGRANYVPRGNRSPAQCVQPDCQSRDHVVRGLCRSHSRVLPCLIPDEGRPCGEMVVARGLCLRHYTRRRNGQCVVCLAPMRERINQGVFCRQPDCRNDLQMAVRFARHARPARPGLPPIGQMVYSPDGEPQCHVCGQFVRRSLGQHSRRSHGITADEYREEFELNRQQGLSSEAAFANYSAIARKRRFGLVNVTHVGTDNPRPYMPSLRLQALINRSDRLNA